MIDPDDLTLAARRIQWGMAAAIALILAMGLYLAGSVVADPGGVGETLAGLAGFPSAAIGPSQSLALVAIAALHFAIWIVLFELLRRLFGQLAEGRPEAAARSARRVSHWLWAMLVWGVISQTAVSVLATWGNPVGERALKISLGSSELLVALSAVIAAFMARAFALGAELWRDHREVV